MVTVAYVRVSTDEQNPDRQLDNLTYDKAFIDFKGGGDTNRPELDKMLSYCREGDNLVIHSMDRLARNTQDLLSLVNYLVKNGVTVRFIKENLTFDGNESPISKLMMTIMAAVAEFELSIIRERQKEGIAIAKAKGKYKGRQRVVTNEELSVISELLRIGVSKARIAKRIGVSTKTVYNYLHLLP